jgi:hypothetical protein
MLSIRNVFHYCVIPLLIVIVLIGCGRKGPKVVPVAGTLTYKGQPVPNIEIHFLPVSGDRPSWGHTDNQGRFELEYEFKVKGASVGEHKVIVRPKPAPDIYNRPVQLPKDMQAFMQKYSAENSTKVVKIDKAIDDLRLDWD